MEVYEILSALDVTKAPQIDSISNAVLWHCASSLLMPIIICMSSIQK